MFYCDTSFLTPLMLEEAASTAVETFLGTRPEGALCVSYFTKLEFSSLLAREVRMRGLTAAAALAAARQFDELLAQSYAIILPEIEDYLLADRFIRQFATGLRAGDALHLAIAKNHGAQQLYTLDQGLLKAGKLLRIPVSQGIRR